MSKIEVDTIAPQSGTTVTLGESGDTVTIPSGVTLANSGTATGFGISWQSAIKTASFTAVAGEGYWINTTSSAITMTLPASASVGDQIIFTDYARTWGTNAVTVNQNSLKFQGQTSPNPVYNTNGQSVNIVYSGATKGWIPNSDDDVTDEVPQTYSIEYLVIAGGASGGLDRGGGGGAGGYRASYNNETSGGGGSSESTPYTNISAGDGTVFTVTIGAGGAAKIDPSAGQGNAGSNSTVTDGSTAITSTGGGGGGSQTPFTGGAAGGSGGGAGGSSPVGGGGTGTANQGFDGGDENTSAPAYGAGGGGGAGAAGADGTSSIGGAGGNGVASTITGSSVTRGGGGGGNGGAENGPSGAGGSGGGGAGNQAPSGSNGTAGTANTGGGGGSGHPPGNSGAGGSGVVILRLPTYGYSGTTTGSPTVTTDGTDTILTFTGSGSYTN